MSHHWKCLLFNRRLVAGMNLSLAVVLMVSTTATAQIRWRSGKGEPADMSGEEIAQKLDELLQNDWINHIVVQFDAPVTDSERAELLTAGYELQGYLGENAYFAVLDRGVMNQVGVSAPPIDFASVSWVRPEWKMHSDFFSGKTPTWALVDNKDESNLRIAAYVMFHRDVLVETVGARTVRAFDGVVVDELYPVNGLVIELPFDNVQALAKEDVVQYIEPAMTPFVPMNDGIRFATYASDLNDPPYNLRGYGMMVTVWDEGEIRPTHPDLDGRVFNYEDGFHSYNSHATHVAGTIAGNGTQSTGNFAGIAPEATIWCWEADEADGTNDEFLYSNPGDLALDFETAIAWGTDVINASIGNDPAYNSSVPCEWEGDYGVTSALIDSIVAGAFGNPARIVWAGGNERGVSRCGNQYATIPPPAGAKNHLSVGSVHSNNLSMTSLSSWGPTDDGRIKPDFCAPGDQQGGDNGITSTNSSLSGGYTVKEGTSSAAAAVSGIVALLLEDWKNHNPNEPLPTNATLKAWLSHTAIDIESPGPDYKTGYGAVHSVDALELMRSQTWTTASLSQGGLQLFVVPITANDDELKVTIAWDDPAGTPNVVPALVNNLDLYVVGPGSQTYYPWTLSPNDPSAPAVQIQADFTNNIEQVHIDAPTPGTYLVFVEGTAIGQGPQTFTLCATPDLQTCASRGVINLDRAEYPCYGGTANVRVIDCDLNTNPNAVESVDVILTSETEPTGEVVTLTETGPDTDEFSGSIIVTTALNIQGRLSITVGDTVTATYIDADDGNGGQNVPVISTASIDCEPPVPYNIEFLDITPRTARIEFATDEPAVANIYYGAICGQPTGLVYGNAFKTRHSLTMTDLVDGTFYYVIIELYDEAGNIGVSDNGELCWEFETPEIPNYYTEHFSEDDFDLSFKAIHLSPNGTFDFYGGCTESIGAFPTDPTGGTALNAGDDSSINVTLSGGADVWLYGQSYTSFFVGSNGYITFGSSDTGYSESIWRHFSKPRVAGLFEDLDPGDGGTVSYKQLDDHVAVTWDNIPHHSNGGSNNMQVLLYFDGRITIAYLGMTASEGIAGISQGNGEPPEFFESNLSSLGECGPRPPSVAGATWATDINIPVTIQLNANDDGLPNPPGMVTYHIDTLPDGELRDFGNDYLIAAGDLPYELVNGLRRVRYTPPVGYEGYDEFAFFANDGGLPPEGGDSNNATIVLEIGDVSVDYYTELFTNGVDLDYTTLLFIPGNSFSYYDGCSFEVTSFPTNPAGGTTITLSDDNYELVSLTGGATVSLYGISYDQVYVCSNGYLTFGGSDTDHSESLSDHFEMPRISMLFDDMNPPLGGTISYKQLVDRFVVTYDDVREYGTTNTASYQVELFFDGQIAIHYLDIGNSDGLAGLSAGLDEPEDFEMSDLSAMGVCGPRPPSADDIEVQTPVGTPLTIELSGSDDGLPDPPGALTYIVTSLPNYQLKDLANNHIITQGDLPYTLFGGSRNLFYTPPDFNAFDGFEYKVSDGGNLPGGGDSSMATVSITVGGPEVVYSFDLDTNPGWSTEGEWEWGEPTGGGTHAGDPSSGITGDNVYGYNLEGDYPNNMPLYYLTTTPMDLSNVTNVELKFWRWLGVESSTYDHATLEASADGTVWVILWEHSSGAINESTWTHYTYDVSDQADGASGFRVRWSMGPTDTSTTYPGWNIDDIEIWGVVAHQSNCPFDLDDNGAVGPGDVGVVKNSFGCDVNNPECAALDFDENGAVGPGDVGAVKNAFGPCP